MKINTKQTIKKELNNHKDVTVNYENGIAFNLDVKTRLYIRVAGCLVGEPKFYQSINVDGTINTNEDKEIINDILTISKTDPEFILKLAVHARQILNLRTISLVLLAEASLIDSCKQYVRQYTPMIVLRADELAEVIAYIQKKIGHLGNKKSKGSLPSAIKKGLADAFNNFNEYQFSKYNSKGFVKLKDALKLVHPTPKSKEQSLIFKRILTDSLAVPQTWEVEISKGSTKENWENIIPKMGYMALLRNLRNFLDKNIDSSALLYVTEKLIAHYEIKKSKQLPFRFFSAYKEVEKHNNINTSKVLDSLQIALDHSIENLPKLNGITFIASDNSGSMNQALSQYSKVTYKDTANILLAIAHKICDTAITSVFGDDFKVIHLSNRDGIISNMKIAENTNVGCSTNTWKAIDYLIANKIKVDRIIILSDEQSYDSSQSFGQTFIGYKIESTADRIKQYKRFVNPNVFVYSINLAGYGITEIPQDEKNICKIAGWSERVLEYIKLFESDKKQVIERITNHTARNTGSNPVDQANSFARSSSSLDKDAGAYNDKLENPD